ncbi:hypothetical protein PP175_26065 (plasmid) [Aneurinibacillus sp. Ricciae_BoGa-3]|uniref:hypothetical protein n=1 Tax=Aneurinibacillus sp. Ricciae_BoGa-3 TaxID=3022697 RepID=UPI002341AD37|nr:hypothetical protein [Aneurinibacillus sp. Ricciae_BoGa-3]WCK57533.1 hypothetical protein PP175_26065 [Aneurinibacillus sp. Ricciae_BoGa-3]
MSVNFNHFMEIIKREDIKEVHLIEGQVPYLVVLTKLKEPVLLNGNYIEEGIETVPFRELGVVTREDCLNIDGFQKREGKNLLPNDKEHIVDYQNEQFRLAVVDSSLSPGFVIHYRKLIKRNWIRLQDKNHY